MLPEVLYPSTRPIDRLQAYEQKYGTSCGPASLVIAYNALGRAYSEKRVMMEGEINLTGAEWADMISHVVDKAGYGVLFRARSSWEDVKIIHELRGNPIIVCWQTERSHKPTEGDFAIEPAAHFSVVKRITDADITLVDPGFGDIFTIPRQYFEERWYEENTEKCFMEIRP